MKLSQFRTPQLAGWRDARLKTVAASSFIRDVNWLRNACAVARKEWKWLEHNPFDGLRLPKRSRAAHPARCAAGGQADLPCAELPHRARSKD
ncbi:hypothetical protein ACKZDW_04340 (plasmid) [Ralstonia syzygii subsp. celebesensis]